MIDTQESMTAKLCSFARAYHSNFEREKIFDDYLAYDLMGKEEYEEIGQLIENNYDVSAYDDRRDFRRENVKPVLNEYISPIPLSRIAFAEGKLQDFAKTCGICQYVICGAGMDTFAFRNDNPDIQIYELDHPDTGRYKQQRIRQIEWIIPPNVHYVPVDFVSGDMGQALCDAGFDPKLPTFFAILGVTYYLPLPVFEQTVAQIGQAARGECQIVFDFPDEQVLVKEPTHRIRYLRDVTERLGEPMQHGFSMKEIKKAMHVHGFEITVHESPCRIQEKFFEGRTDGQRAYENIHFIIGEKSPR